MAELERLANEMFRAGPEGAGLGADVPAARDASAEAASRGLPAALDGTNGRASGGPPVEEALQWSYLVDGARPTSPGAVSAIEPDPRIAPGVPSAPASVPTGDLGAEAATARPVDAADLFALHGDRLSLADLGLAEVPRVSAAEPTAGSYYFVSESLSYARSHPRSDEATVPAPAAPSSHPAFDVEALRRDFPALAERVHGSRRLVWLDNAATTQKPEAVISRVSHFYRHENSNIHRAAHEMAARATDAYEAARDTVATFLNAPSSDEIVFLRGATEAINLVAQAWGRQNVRAGDEIVITWLEHHANIVPWQQLCQETGAVLRVVPVEESGQVMLGEYEKLLGPSTRLVAFAHVSNALGTVTPVREMVEMAHRHGAVVLVDGAQAVSHMRVDVQQLDCDWYAFSGHKVFGPTGIGVLYGKADLLNTMPPWQGGGNMIQDVTFEKTRYQPAPVRFEAGTASIAGAVGLGAALDYLQRIGIENVTRYEQELLAYATEALLTVPGLHLIGTAPEKASVLSFVLDGFEAEDVGKALDREGIALRAGHHCAQPIVRHYGHESTIRASLAVYNTREEIDALITALRSIVERGVQL
ncbi:MAG TPA: family 2A encapsulin nanocompartment cargo protein cysteine desulfurase [Solirubrobacteraceae bacterium]|nr:family 2A encapsulin nanocompartment cargo protein cysteine desulfurase [Solirubrobacteraceae bacterium]